MNKEYLPYIGREVWIKMEVVREYISLRTLGLRERVYNVYSYTEDMTTQICESVDVLRAKPTDSKLSVFFIPNHGLIKAAKVRLSSTGSLPAPLLDTSDYWVIALSDSQIQLANSELNARGGNPIYFNNQGIGTHTIEPNIESGPWTEFRQVPHGMYNY